MQNNNYNGNSYRNADSGETHDESPRIISSHLRVTFGRIEHLTKQLNFNLPIFAGMLKRNRSFGSTQALICELAFADRRFINENLLPFCIADGMNVLLPSDPLDYRLNAYLANKKSTFVVDESGPYHKLVPKEEPEKKFWGL